MLSREPQNSKLPVVCKQKIDEACNWVIKKKKKESLVKGGTEVNHRHSAAP